MRTLPVIERILVICLAVMVVALLGLLAAWHARFARLLAYRANLTPLPGAPVMPAPPPQPDPALAAECAKWFHGNVNVDAANALPYEIDHLRDLIAAAAPAPRENQGATEAELAGLIARGMRLDGAPIPDWRAPQAEFQNFEAIYNQVPSMEIGLSSLAYNWLRQASRPADAAAVLRDFDVAVAGLDQPATIPGYRRWLRMQGARDAVYVLTSLNGADGGSDGRNFGVNGGQRSAHARGAAWLAEPGVGFAVLVTMRERLRIDLLPMYVTRQFSVLPHINPPWADVAGEIVRWWRLANQAKNSRWEVETDDTIARRRGAARNVWQPWKRGSQMVPGLPALGIRADALHRLAVLAARMLDARGADGAFPADNASGALGISAADLAGHGDMPPLIMHVDAQHLFIAIDRRATLAPYLADCFAPVLSTTAEDGALPFSLTPEAVSIDVGDAAVRTIIAGGGAAAATATATATGAATAP